MSEEGQVHLCVVNTCFKQMHMKLQEAIKL